MTSADRTFRAFLDVLEATLDEPDLSGSDLAARLHLSRFHADRLVAAAAGEPPGALRRRILLERAAYRLATAQDPLRVVDLALEAGFDSHDGFTRAFTRAFGAPPSMWRKAPRSHLLPAPSRVHFQPPGSLRLPSDRRITAMDLVTRMTEHHVWLVGEMVDRAGRLDPDALDRPITLSVEGIDDDPTLRSLLARLAGQLAMWLAAVDNRPYDVGAERGLDLAQIRTLHAEAGAQFLDLIRRVTGSDGLDETFVDATCDPPQVFTYGGMLAHVLTFAAHRRTLVCGALHDAGITDLAAGDPMTWVSA